MASKTSAASAEDAGDNTVGLGRVLVLIVLVEIVTVAALYWFGRHFA